MNITPLFDRVVVKTLPQKSEKIGNIILPEITKRPEIRKQITGIKKLTIKDLYKERLLSFLLNIATITETTANTNGKANTNSPV